MADIDCNGEFVKRNNSGVALSPFETTDILFAKAGLSGNLFLRQAFFLTEASKISQRPNNSPSRRAASRKESVVTHRFDDPKQLQHCLPGSAEPNRPELEQQAVEAIRQHRCLVDSAQILYDEWIDLANDPKTPATVTRAMHADYISRQRQISEQQDALANMLTVLGYIPNNDDIAG
jgi:hypothetical protein